MEHKSELLGATSYVKGQMQVIELLLNNGVSTELLISKLRDLRKAICSLEYELHNMNPYSLTQRGITPVAVQAVEEAKELLWSVNDSI